MFCVICGLDSVADVTVTCEIEGILAHYGSCWGHIVQVAERMRRDAGTGRHTEELERLRRWQREAVAVLCEWEEVWIAAGRPGRLGQSKAGAVRDLFQNAETPPDRSLGREGRRALGP